MPSNRQEQLPSLRSKNSTVKEANGTYNGTIVNVKTDAGSNEPEETAKTFTDYERLAKILQVMNKTDELCAFSENTEFIESSKS